MRKEPIQARSRNTVHSIVDAATQVLSQHGWAGFNTNDVAERAGVSIGTLYQYFPDKLALIEAIRDKHFAEVLGTLRAALSSDGEVSELSRSLITGMISAHSSPRLHAALLEDAPLTTEGKALHMRFEEAYLNEYVSLLKLAGWHGTTKGLRASARVIAGAVEGMVHTAILHKENVGRDFFDLASGIVEQILSRS